MLDNPAWRQQVCVIETHSPVTNTEQGLNSIIVTYTIGVFF